jgi:hypothetical protein
MSEQARDKSTGSASKQMKASAKSLNQVRLKNSPQSNTEFHRV